jgi:hypothetical protein
VGVLDTTDAKSAEDLAIDHYNEVNHRYCDGDATWDELIEAYGDIAVANGEPGGAPMPHPTIRLTMETSYPGSRYNGGVLASIFNPEKYKAEQEEKREKEEKEEQEGKAKKYELMADPAGITPVARLNNMFEPVQLIEMVSKAYDKHLGKMVCLMKQGNRYWFTEDNNLTEHVVNRWYSKRLDRYVFLMRKGEKRWVETNRDPWKERWELMISTFSAGGCWSHKAELRAMELLKGLVSDQNYAQYVLLGCFTETSKKTGLTYLFRKLKPTVVMRNAGDSCKIITALCAHPIGFYEGSFAGAMVPTDDVVSALTYMRTDEYKFWSLMRRASP